MDNLTPHAKHILDVIALSLAGLSVATASLISFLPIIASALSIIWSILRFLEMFKARKFKRRMTDRRNEQEIDV